VLDRFGWVRRRLLEHELQQLALDDDVPPCHNAIRRAGRRHTALDVARRGERAARR
jgi:hypothetical protein